MARKNRPELARVSSKICQECGEANYLQARHCAKCAKQRFAPTFVRKVEKVNRQFYVQVTRTLGDDSKKPFERVTLYKWWPVGNRATFHINSLEQWERVRSIVETKLAPYLGWRTTKEISTEIKKAVAEEEEGKKSIARVTKKAGVIHKILRSLDFSRIPPEDSEDLVEIIQELAVAATNADKSLFQAFRKVFREIKRSPAKAVSELGELLGKWSLTQVTQITREVTRRLETLDLFRDRVLDDETYEIRGDNSIHRVLEGAMWIIDERYWLMHSNRTLREVVGKQMAEKEKRYEKQRPDFVCGTVEGKLVVVELKRPSHKLDVDDLNQLETYVDIMESNSSYTVGEAILLGRQISDELRRRRKYRGHQFKVWSYAEVLDETEKRYKTYLAAND